jgi:hypothetical protein
MPFMLICLIAGCATQGSPGGNVASPVSMSVAAGAHATAVDWKKDGAIANGTIQTRRLGGTLVVDITASVANNTTSPVAVTPDTNALVYVRVMRKAFLGWQEVARYPKPAGGAAAPWTLDAHDRQTFTLQIPVEADWPAGETLKLVACVSGLPDVCASTFFRASLTR